MGRYIVGKIAVEHRCKKDFVYIVSKRCES
jgi:hypothetical protein